MKYDCIVTKMSETDEEAKEILEIADSAGIDEDDARMLYEEGIRPEDI